MNITHLAIGTGITSIGTDAFKGCTHLETVTMNCKEVDNWFSNFTTIKTVNLEDQVSSIGAGAFANCTALTTLTIPASVNSIGDAAFSGCTALESVAIPEGVTTIPDGAFSNCSSLSNLTLPSTLISIGNNAFYGCSLLKSVVLPEGITSVGDGAFSGCTQLESLSIPSSLTSIGTNAFGNCPIKTLDINCPTINKSFSGMSSIETINFGNSVESIGNSAFANCTGLKSITIPSSVTSIGTNAFAGCTSSTSISLQEGIAIIPAGAFSNNSSLTELSLPSSLTTIGDNAFNGCTYLTELTIPEAITSIGAAAFKGCPITELTFNAKNCRTCGTKTTPAFDNTIKQLTFHKDALYIPPYMLSGGSQIQNLTIPNKVTEIGQEAFSKNTLLKSVTIGAGVTKISQSAFPVAIPKVFWLANTPPVDYDEVQALSNFTSNDQYKFYKGTGDRAPIIYPFLSSKFEVGGVIYVPVSPSERTCDVIDCDYYATGDAVVIPPIVTNQGINLKVYNISNFAFYDNSSFSTLTLSELTDKIGAHAFDKCRSISHLSFPCGVSSIGDGAFAYCTSVTGITFEDEKTRTDAITLGSNGKQGLFHDCPVTRLYIGRKLDYMPGENTGYSPFAYITTLQDVEIADYEVKVGDFEFYMCTSLQRLKIGNRVKTIGKWAYSGDYSLEYYSAGIGVESIGEEAFSDCTGVTEFYSYSVNPPECGEQSLDDINKWNCTLYIPTNSDDEYRAAPQWKDFFHIEEMEIPEVAEIRLDRTSTNMTIGMTLQLKATILPSEAANTPLIWTSSDERTVTVSETGMMTALAAGTATVTASVENGRSASCTVNVAEKAIEAESITLNLEQIELTEGESVQIIATVMPDDAADKSVTWLSSDATVATVDAFGIVNGIMNGTATITATTVNGLSATCTVKVNATSLSGESVTLNLDRAEVTEGESLQLTATVTSEEATDKSVTWSSSDETIAAVDANGLVKGIKNGMATITATTVSGHIATCNITVKSKTVEIADFTLNLDRAEITEGESLQLAAKITPEEATDKSVTWSSSDETIATVSANGLVRGIKTGIAIITATAANGMQASCVVLIISDPSAIANLNEDSTVSITADNGVITVHGAKKAIEVYNITGVLVKRLNAETITGLSKGIYIVRIGNKAYKVRL